MTNRYKLRGVSSDKEDVHNAIKNHDKGLYPKAFCKILPDLISNSDDHALIIHSDGAERSLPEKIQNKNKPDPTALNDIHPVTKMIQFIFIF